MADLAGAVEDFKRLGGILKGFINLADELERLGDVDGAAEQAAKLDERIDEARKTLTGLQHQITEGRADLSQVSRELATARAEHERVSNLHLELLKRAGVK